jgi:NAD(P)-dependent dehydrogenase (short-subunit alcohol dehydrogenase family)
VVVPDDSSVPDYPSLLRLDGRGAVVLGAGQGMGRQTAHALASVGAQVLCVDVDSARAERVADEVGGIPWSGDMSGRNNVEQLFDFAVRELPAVHHIVDIIGITRAADLVEFDDDSWRSQFDVVLHHALLAMQIGSRVMPYAEGASMAFVGSVSGIYGAAWHAGYGAAKAALMHLVKSAAVEFAPLGIRVNAVAPGRIATPIILSQLTPERRADYNAAIPLGRMGETSEIASVLLFLLGSLSSYITGQTLLIDGGVGASSPYVKARELLLAPPAVGGAAAS